MTATNIQQEGSEAKRAAYTGLGFFNPGMPNVGNGDISANAANAKLFTAGSGDISASLDSYKLPSGNYPSGGSGEL